MAEVQQLTIHKLANKSKGERVVRYDPFTGAKVLVNPETHNVHTFDGEWIHTPWPLAGVEFVGAPPECTEIPTDFVARGLSEGWLSVENERVAHRPGGSAEDQWAKTHTFKHYDSLVFHTIDGNVRYLVVHNPDKYVDSDDPTERVTPEHYAAGETRVDHFYRIELDQK